MLKPLMTLALMISIGALPTISFAIDVKETAKKVGSTAKSTAKKVGATAKSTAKKVELEAEELSRTKAARDVTQGVGDFFQDLGQKIGIFNKCRDSETKSDCKTRRDQEKHIRKQTRILERRGFEIKISDKERARVVERINSFNGQDSCEFGKRIPGARRLAHYDEILQEMMPSIQENYSESCLNSLASYYHNYKTAHDNPSEHKYCQESDCQFVQEKLEQFNNNYANLSSRIENINQSNSAICVLRRPEIAIESSLDVEALLQELPQLNIDIPEISREPSSFSLEGNGDQNCPNEEQVIGLKAMMVESQLSGAFLLCEREWSTHNGLNSFKSQNQNLFVTTDGRPVSGTGPIAHAYRTFIANRIQAELPETREGSDSYITSLYGPIGNSRSAGFQARESLGTKLLNVSMAPDLHNGSRQNHCDSIANEMVGMLNTNNSEDLLSKVMKSSFANNPEVWKRALSQIKDEKGLGACEIPVE